MALYGGGFRSSRGQGFFAGPVFDYRTGSFQIFLLPKYNYVDWDSDWTKEDNDGFIIKFLDRYIGHHAYMQTVLGFNVWFNDNVGMSLYGHFFSSVSGSTEYKFKDGVVGGSELLLRF